jgi:hypothetical protein
MWMNFIRLVFSAGNPDQPRPGSGLCVPGGVQSPRTAISLDPAHHQITGSWIDG